MQKVSFYIDGFNLYHSILKADWIHKLKGKGVKWLDLNSLCTSFLHRFGRDAVIEDIYYFSAFARHLYKKNPEILERHKLFVKANKSKGIIDKMGRFKPKTIYHKCEKTQLKFLTFEEKQSDVAIGINVINDLHTKDLDHIIVMSGDGDLLPLIKMVNDSRYKTTIRFAFPYWRHNKHIKRQSTDSFNIKLKNYLRHQFPNRVTIGDETITKPKEW